MLSVQPRLRGSKDRKMAIFQFFSVQATGDSPTGPDPENKVGDQDTGSPGRPVSCLAGKNRTKQNKTNKQTNKLDESSRLDVVEIARVA
jgi:hypothetical protein